MVVEQPLKTPFVAAVVLVANSLKPEVLAELLTTVTTATEEKVRAGDWRDVKLYLKFLACLQGSLEGEGLFPVLEDLFSRAVDLQTGSSDDVSMLVCPMRLATHLLTHIHLDHWNRTRQDYTPYHSLYNGCCPRPVAAESSRAHGQDGRHCF